MSRTENNRFCIHAPVVTTFDSARCDETGDPYGRIADASLVVDGEAGTILWVGPHRDLPEQFATLPRERLDRCVVTPGLVDCHTHLVHGGHRAREFERRLEGASYEEIAREGGGILSTVAATRAASPDVLFEDTIASVEAMVAQGVTTLEIKSGYGLTIADEIKMLRVAREVGESVREDVVTNRSDPADDDDIEDSAPPTILTSWLAAHALPPEYADRRDDYINEVVIRGLREAHGQRLVDMVDGFCEGIAFSTDEIARVFDAAKELGLPVRLHAEQLSNQGGAALAAQYGALSADHLEYLDDTGVAAMAAAGTVAVLLPGAFYTLQETQAPPVAALRAAGIPMAVASDANPGSSPIYSPLVALNMACTLFHLTPAEALAGMTREGARALGLSDRGVLAPGMRADIAIWEVDEPAELAYRIAGESPLIDSLIGGRP